MIWSFPAFAPRGVHVVPLITVALCAACAGATRPPGIPIPPAEGAEVAATLERSTRLEWPAEYRFDWSFEERGATLKGSGVARAEPPDRGRLDLFTGNGETVATAALLENDLRLPRATSDEIREIIPPSSLLWAALGVFSPDKDATFQGAERSGESVELNYVFPDGRGLRYTVLGTQVTEVELLEKGRALHQITLTPAAGQRYPQEAVYRNLAKFRVLKLLTRSVEHVEPFPSSIWSP